MLEATRLHEGIHVEVELAGFRGVGDPALGEGQLRVCLGHGGQDVALTGQAGGDTTLVVVDVAGTTIDDAAGLTVGDEGLHGEDIADLGLAVDPHADTGDGQTRVEIPRLEAVAREVADGLEAPFLGFGFDGCADIPKVAEWAEMLQGLLQAGFTGTNEVLVLVRRDFDRDGVVTQGTIQAGTTVDLDQISCLEHVRVEMIGREVGRHLVQAHGTGKGHRQTLVLNELLDALHNGEQGFPFLAKACAKVQGAGSDLSCLAPAVQVFGRRHGRHQALARRIPIMKGSSRALTSTFIPFHAPSVITMNWLLILAIAAIVILLFYVIGLYNRFVRLENRIDNAEGQIDVQLQRRGELIPNLMETVKGYMKHEKEVLENVTKARSALMGASGLPAKMAADGALEGALGRLFAVAEAYPDLKANTNFLQFQEELAHTENKIAFARQAFNDSVQAFNDAIEVFPANIVANVTGKGKERDMLEAPPETRAVPKVSF